MRGACQEVSYFPRARIGITPHVVLPISGGAACVNWVLRRVAEEGAEWERAELSDLGNRERLLRDTVRPTGCCQLVPDTP